MIMAVVELTPEKKSGLNVFISFSTVQIYDLFFDGCPRKPTPNQSSRQLPTELSYNSKMKLLY